MVIELNNVTKDYKKLFAGSSVRALNNVSFSINEGEVIGLIGPNGSGKTTTMKIILGLLQPTSGNVKVFDRNPRSKAIKHRIGFVPEESYLYEFLNAKETLDFYGRLFGVTKKHRASKSKELIELVGLGFAGKRMVKEYSKGMTRRLCIAQALINDPDIVILDEPTSGLDPVSSKEIRNMILRLQSEGKTILVSSHLLADIQNVCNRIILLNNGNVECVDQVSNLLTDKDILSIRCKNISDGDLDKIKKYIEEIGGEVISVDNSRYTLEDIFFKIINKNNQEPTANSK